MKIMKDQVGFQLAVMAFLCATLPSAVLGQSGEDACEGQKFNEEQCLAVGCCEWDDDMCWSAVGKKDCKGGGVATSSPPSSSLSLSHSHSHFRHHYHYPPQDHSVLIRAVPKEN